MRNRIMSTENHVIMAFTSILSAIFHGGLFFTFGGGFFYALSVLSKDGELTADDYIAVIIMMALCMFHCFTFACLLEKSFKTRTWGYSMVTLVLEVLIIPIYCLLGIGFSDMPYGKLLLLFAVMMFVSLVGNIYCVIRHTLTK